MMMAEDSDIHVANSITKEGDLNSPEGLPEDNDQHGPVVTTKETDQHPSRRKRNIPISVFFKDARHLFKRDELGRQIWSIAFPAALALASDPVASLIDTAFIGRLGSVELAAVGVSIAIFNQVSRITIFPLVSITTSFVAKKETVGKVVDLAEDENPEKCSTENVEMKELTPDDEMLEKLENDSTTHCEVKDLVPAEDFAATPCESPPMINSKTNRTKLSKQRQRIPSASTALVIGGILGVLQTLFLLCGAETLLTFMGVKSGSPMLTPARKYLTLRSLGAPAVLLSLAMQGVFRDFKDNKTPLYATVAGDLANIVLDPILIFVCHLGVSGAAIAHVISQYLISLILLWRLMKQVDLLPPSLKDLQFRQSVKNGFFLLARMIGVTFCVTLGASMAARLGSTPMAAFQICLQVWMTSSLLAAGLAVAGQAILAYAFAEKDYDKATAAASRVLQMGFVLGLGLALLVGVGLRFGSGVFTKDVNVQHLIFVCIPFVAAIQPINSLAFVFDGINLGASDFAYSAYSMVVVSISSIASLFLLSESNGYVGIWVALTIYMGFRTLAGIWRMGTGTGPWCFLWGGLLP